jgi:Putative adhesin
MKRLCSVLMSVALSLVLTACYVHVSGSSGWSSASLHASTNIVQSGAIPADIKTLEVINAFGAVHVTGEDQGPGGWSQNLTVRARTDAVVQEIASNYLCEAQVVGGRFRLVVTATEVHQPHSFQSDLEITVPKSVAVQTRDQYGTTEISGLSGGVEAVSQFGAMEVHDIGGQVRAETSYATLKVRSTGPATLRNQFGAIEAADIHGPLDAETSYAVLDARDISGKVKLRDQFGRLQLENAGEADVKTSYGELSVKEIKGDARMVNQFGRVAAEDVTGSVKAETSYGPMDITGSGTIFDCDNQFGGITVRATSSALASVQARTSYAALEVRLPAGLKPAVQAHTSYGDIESDFPVLGKSRSLDSPGAQVTGAPRIDLHNQNGKIRVVGE